MPPGCQHVADGKQGDRHVAGHCERQLETKAGEVTLKVPKGTQSGQLTRLRGKGVQRKGKVGDLYVRFLVRMPQTPSKAVAKAISELDEALMSEPPVRAGIKL